MSDSSKRWEELALKVVRQYAHPLNPSEKTMLQHILVKAFAQVATEARDAALEEAVKVAEEAEAWACLGSEAIRALKKGAP